MRCLLICALPADEITLYGNVVLNQADVVWDAILVFKEECELFPRLHLEHKWRLSCQELGITARDFLACPLPAQRSAERLARCFPRHIVGYERVYLPDICDRSEARRVATGTVAAFLRECWMECAAGIATAIEALDEQQTARLMTQLNNHYAELLSTDRVTESDLRGVRQYRCLPGAFVHRYARQFQSMDVLNIADTDPWDLCSSEYEQRRHELELATLAKLEWETLLEVGACQGAFTERLLQVFPGRRVSVCEPNPHFYADLRRKCLPVAEASRDPVAAFRTQYDVVLASNVLYYIQPFPLNILDVARSYLVLSNPPSYQSEVVMPLLQMAGWAILYRTAVLPRIELFARIPVVKAGSEITVWHRENS